MKQTIESTAFEAAAGWLGDRRPTAPGRKMNSIGGRRSSKRPQRGLAPEQVSIIG